MLNELLGGVAVGDIGLSGIVILIVLMILTDRLVTRRRLEEAREDARTYRSAAEKQQLVNATNADSLRELLELGRATHHALTEIQALGQFKQEHPA